MPFGSPRHHANGRPPGISFGEGLAALALILSIATFSVVGWTMTRSDASERGSGGGSGSAAPSPTPSPSPSPSPTPMSGKIPPPGEGELYWGVYMPDVPWHMEHMDHLVQLAGHVPAIDMWYEDWSGRPDFEAALARKVLSRGIVPMVTWQPKRPGNPPNQITLRGLARGKYDTYIRKYAKSVAQYGGPLFFRMMHEMDGDWYLWSGYSRGNTPKMYIRAWRHIHDIFQKAGAKNVTWVWSVNHRSVPHVPGNQIHRFWPGPTYVDWVGISGFNPGPLRAPYKWQSFGDVNRERYLNLLQYDKPVMVSETASPEVGGDKALWIHRMWKAILAHYPKLGALIWFNSRDPKHPKQDDWRIQSSRGSLDAFRSGLDDKRVQSAPTALHLTEQRAP